MRINTFLDLLQLSKNSNNISIKSVAFSDAIGRPSNSSKVKIDFIYKIEIKNLAVL